ncbi:MAG: DNA repair protein RecN [Bacteroidota bacterium]|nr:DNA repair protein RecN [Bacteroidota bacterium]
MLKKLSVKNFALIESLVIDFNSGFSVITGETGAGKSILLGALSLVLGNRADTSALKNTEEKCIVESEYDISKFKLNGFFENNGLDYFDTAILRREISPQGRSRAFINDTPVKLSLMKELGDSLTDIHSQHHNLELRNRTFQLYALNAYAGLLADTEKFGETYSNYRNTMKQLEALKKEAEEERTEQDYYQFRFDELDQADLKSGEKEVLENRRELITNSAEIKSVYSQITQLLTDNEFNVSDNLQQAVDLLTRVEKYLPEAADYKARIKSALIDLQDISSETEIKTEDVEYSQAEAEEVQNRLDVIYGLEKKYRVSTIEELLQIKEELDEKISDISSYDRTIKDLENKLLQEQTELKTFADKLTKNRKRVKGPFESEIKKLLIRLGMPNSEFRIDISQKDNFGETGKDEVSFLFSGNKNVAPDEISKIASGGEISRLMLSLKAVTAKSVNLPTIIFDEIDTGISGDIADKTGLIMKEMAENIQVVDITHLPQIAAKAQTHYIVFKQETNSTTFTNVRLLNHNERINEIAKMLSGEAITDAAVGNAKALLEG